MRHDNALIIKSGTLLQVTVEHLIAMPLPQKKIPMRRGTDMIFLGKGKFLVALERVKDIETATNLPVAYWHVLTPFGFGWVEEQRLEESVAIT